MCVIFLPNGIMDNEKMGEVPGPKTDRVSVAVRVRPFSQVSPCALPCRQLLPDFINFLIIVTEFVFKLLVIYEILNLFNGFVK